MSLSKIIDRCQFKPAVQHGQVRTQVRTNDAQDDGDNDDGTYSITSFFLDSSGRSSFSVPLEMVFESAVDMEGFLDHVKIGKASGQFETDANALNGATEDERTHYFALELKKTTSETDAIDTFSVESVQLAAFKKYDKKFVIKADVVVRALASTDVSESNAVEASESNAKAPPSWNSAKSDVSADIEFLGVVKPLSRDLHDHGDSHTSNAINLQSLELGALPGHFQGQWNRRRLRQEYKLPPITVTTTLVPAFYVDASSMRGQSNGETLVSLVIRHSNSHDEAVAISNIAIHAGHSVGRAIRNSENKDSGSDSQFSSVNMTKCLQWHFVKMTELDLPLTLRTNDVYSTVIAVSGSEKMRMRELVSPLSVTATLDRDTDSMDEVFVPSNNKIVAASEIRWRTDLVAVEPADAFKITMNIDQSECFLGEPATVRLRIFNLNVESRTLMLLVAKEDMKRKSTGKHEEVNTALVSDIGGYTFGLWGVSPADDGTVKLNRDNDMLAMDAALILGEVNGQHAVDAQLRFIPLREGFLKVPNWRLYDKSAGKWYSCSHQLGIVGKWNPVE